MQGSKFLKVMGIISIISGALSFILNCVTCVGANAIMYTAQALGVNVNAGLYSVACILSLLGSAALLVAGIMGVINSAKPEKAMTCVILGAIVIIVSLLSTILAFASYPSGGINFFSILLSLVIPVLYTISAYLTKKNG